MTEDGPDGPDDGASAGTTDQRAEEPEGMTPEDADHADAPRLGPATDVDTSEGPPPAAPPAGDGEVTDEAEDAPDQLGGTGGGDAGGAG